MNQGSRAISGLEPRTLEGTWAFGFFLLPGGSARCLYCRLRVIPYNPRSSYQIDY